MRGSNTNARKIGNSPITPPTPSPEQSMDESNTITAAVVETQTAKVGGLALGLFWLGATEALWAAQHSTYTRAIQWLFAL